MSLTTADVIYNAEQKARNCLQGIVKYQLQVQLQNWQTQHAHAADHVLFKTCDKRVLCQHIYIKTNS